MTATKNGVTCKHFQARERYSKHIQAQVYSNATASFVAMKNGTSPSILNDETMGQTVWLIEGYEPAPVNLPVLAAIEMGTRRWPATPYIGIMNGAAGKEIADFITGKQDAASTLADIEAAYEASAREKGFLE